MIKINLVPLKERKRRKDFLIFGAIGAACVILILGLAWLSLARIQAKNKLTRQIREVEEKSQKYKDQINEVKDLEAKEASLEALKKTIKGVSDAQRKVLTALDQVGLNMPEGIWLTGIVQGKGNDGNKFTIQGYAFTQASLQTYLTSLQKPGGSLKEVTLDIKSIFASAGNNRQIQQFEINARVMD